MLFRNALLLLSVPFLLFPLCGAQQERIPTTHLFILTNGGKLRGNLIKQEEELLLIAIGDHGHFTLRRSHVKAVIKEDHHILRSVMLKHAQRRLPPAKKTPPAPERLTARELAARLTPPPVPPNARGELERWLHHLGRTRAKNRIQAERNLKAMGSIVVGPTIPYAARPQWLIRCAALRILGHVKHPAGVPTLWRALDDPHPIVRQVAHENLIKVTGRRIPFLPHGSPAGRKRAVEKWRDYLVSVALLP